MSHGHDDFETEPIPGLPKTLPDGEDILWQGAPEWRAVALRTFHVRKLALYAAIMVLWNGATTVYDGGTPLAALGDAAITAAIAAAGIGILTWLAYLTARDTMYTITTRRVVMRFGIALPMTVQIPFTKIVNAAVKLHDNAKGTGDIPFEVSERGKISYAVMWPHVRPWTLGRPQPMLRGIAGAERVAKILGDALAADLARAAAAETESESAPASEPAPTREPARDTARHGGLAAAAG